MISLKNKIGYFIASLLLLACSKEELDPSLLGYDFFPLEVGNYLIYEVEETRYSSSQEPQTIVYQLKEEVVESFTDKSGQLIYRLERSTRNNKAQPWQVDSVWGAYRTGSQAVKLENNIPYIKLIFPFDRNSRWNGNALNGKQPQEFVLEQVRKPFIGKDSTLFGTTVKVVHFRDSSLVTNFKREEIFAKNIGLIYTERVSLRYKDEPELLGQGIIEFGTVYKERIIDYGKK